MGIEIPIKGIIKKPKKRTEKTAPRVEAAYTMPVELPASSIPFPALPIRIGFIIPKQVIAGNNNRIEQRMLPV